MAAPDENKVASHESRKNVPLSACGAGSITLGAPLTRTTRAIHCNTAGTATLYFADGSTAAIVLLAGLTYDFAITQADDVSGTPTLKALY